MRILNSLELNAVSGGEVGATKMGDNASYTGYSTAQAMQCANTMMAYGGLGGVIGGTIGGAVGGVFAGAVGSLGTLLGTQYGAKKPVCATPQVTSV